MQSTLATEGKESNVIYNWNPTLIKLGKELHLSADYEKNPHQALVNFAKDWLDDITIAPGRLLVATYRRPEKTKSGLILTSGNLDEDKFQGVAALVLKLGAGCFEDDASTTFRGFKVEQFSWVTFRPAYGVAREIMGLHCRIVEDRHIDSVVGNPTLVW